MTKTQKFLGAMLVSLGMASGAAFGQATESFISGTMDVSGTPAAGGTTTASGTNTTTINSGWDSSSTAGNVVIQSLDNAGGTNSTSMTVGPDGVRLTATGGTNGSGNVKITGVANGTSTYDAVNYGQLMAVQQQVDTLKSGIASVAAMANIPTSSDPKQRVSIGAGVGGYMGKTASAIGATVRITKNLTAKASFSSASGGESTSGIGIAYGW